MYDKNNIFAKIIRGEINSSKIYEDDYLIAINDAYPVAPIHVLIIPKKQYVDYSNFIEKAEKEEIYNFFSKINEIVALLKIKEYRLISNNGKNAGQTIFHFHIHLISNNEKALQKMTE